MIKIYRTDLCLGIGIAHRIVRSFERSEVVNILNPPPSTAVSKTHYLHFSLFFGGGGGVS